MSTTGTNTQAPAPAPARPTRDSVVPLDQIKTIAQAINHPDIKQRFKEAVPRHLSADRMLRVCAQAVRNTPKLGEANMLSLLSAMLGLASLGLEPNTPLGLAYLIPFEKRQKVGGEWKTVRVDVQPMIGYRGYVALARRSGSLVSIHADVVYEGDSFSFAYGSKMHLDHTPRAQSDNPIWAYAHARLTDGEAFEVLPYSRVLAIRNSSQGYQQALRAKNKDGVTATAWATAPWVKHEHEMASKTMIRRLAKVLPLSVEFMSAVNLDEAGDAGVDLTPIMAEGPDAISGIGTALLNAPSDEPIPDEGPAPAAANQKAGAAVTTNGGET